MLVESAGRLFGRASGAMLLLLMLVVPTVYRPIKIALLGATLAGVLISAAGRRRVALHPAIVAGASGFVAVGLAFLYRGLWLGSPGALRMAGVYVVWPVLYTMMLTLIASECALRNLVRLLFVALLAVTTYSLTYILWAAGWWPDALYLPLDQGQAISFFAEVIEFNLYSISSLLFVVPFAIAALIVWPRSFSPIPAMVLWGAVCLGITVSLLTDRRAVLLVVAAAPLFAVLLRYAIPARRDSSRPSMLKVIAGTALLMVVAAGALRWLYGFDLIALGREFMTGFQFSSDPVAMTRASQFERLTGAWLEAPLLGKGFGATIPEFVRSEEMPWAFELSYSALLFNTGLIGMLAYMLGVMSIFGVGFYIVRCGHSLGRLLLPVLVGSGSFLIANATNTYLLKFDYEWVIFLPLAFINCWLLEHVPVSVGIRRSRVARPTDLDLLTSAG
jgi:hypothetical protein